MTLREECMQQLEQCYEEMGNHNYLSDEENEADREVITTLLLSWVEGYLDPYLTPGEAWGDMCERFGIPELQNVISFAYSLGRRGRKDEDNS